MSKPDPFAAELLGKAWPMPIGDRPPALRTFLAPLPEPLPSMLRQQRLCRIALRRLTNEIGQQYAREQADGQGFN
jgi:hypothetical protein